MAAVNENLFTVWVFQDPRRTVFQAKKGPFSMARRDRERHSRRPVAARLERPALAGGVTEVDKASDRTPPVLVRSARCPARSPA